MYINMFSVSCVILGKLKLILKGTFFVSWSMQQSFRNIYIGVHAHENDDKQILNIYVCQSGFIFTVHIPNSTYRNVEPDPSNRISILIG
jgi:hypothetical protein